MAKKKNVETPDPATPELADSLAKVAEATDLEVAAALAKVKADLDAQDAAAAELERQAPQVSVTCEVCGKVAFTPAGTAPASVALALKESGLPLLGCQGTPGRCLSELARHR